MGMRKVRTWVVLAVAALAPAGLGGCYPFSMGIYTPIPVPPWVTERMEWKYCWKNDYRTPILPPIREGVPPPLCEDPPDESRILRAMPQVRRGVPYFYEEFRDNVEIVTERLVDKIDPPRFYPLIGPAQLHHCHWKCTIFYTETVESGYPFPFRCRKPSVEVVMMDLDHLHLYPCGTPDTLNSVTRDLSGP
jgi:hypothetical protein